jgi:hypothetical protein
MTLKHDPLTTPAVTTRGSRPNPINVNWSEPVSTRRTSSD